MTKAGSDDQRSIGYRLSAIGYARPRPPRRGDVSVILAYLRDLERYATALEQEVKRLKESEGR